MTIKKSLWTLVLALAVFQPGQTAVSARNSSGSFDVGDVLTVQGDAFLINGNAQKLLMVSYFDGSDSLMTRTQWDVDFAYFRSINVDGIRVFPNWWTQSVIYGPLSPSDHPLFDCQGTLQNNNINHLTDLLQAAADHGLIVDVTFTKETMECGEAMTPSAYKAAITAVTPLLSSYRNVLFDVQNEWTNHGLSESDVTDIKNAIKGVDGGRVVVASTDQNYNQYDAGCDGEGKLNSSCESGAFALRQDFGAAAHHEPRTLQGGGQDWYIGKAYHDVWIGAVASKPVYMSEPMPFGPRADEDSNAQHFHDAFNVLLSGGAGSGPAWTFHSRTSMVLNGRTLLDILTNDRPSEKWALEHVR